MKNIEGYIVGDVIDKARLIWRPKITFSESDIVRSDIRDHITNKISFFTSLDLEIEKHFFYPLPREYYFT